MGSEAARRVAGGTAAFEGGRDGVTGMDEVIGAKLTPPECSENKSDAW